MVGRSCVLALPLLLTCTAPVLADEVRGVITRIDADKNELVIEGRGIGKRGQSFTFTLGKDLKILFGKEAGVLDDLESGKKIRVVYESKDGTRIATTIHANGPRPARKPAVEGERVVGLLRRVARTDREIIVATPGAEKDKETYTTLPVPDDAKITRDGKSIAFDDLKEEERASVKVEVRKGKKVAVLIEVGVPDKAEAKPPAEMSKIAKARMILKVADAILEMIEKRQQDKK